MNSRSLNASTRLAIATFTVLTSIVLMGAAVWYSLPDPDPERGGIAVTVRGETPSSVKLAASRVYFVRLGEGEDMLGAETMVWSNFSANKQVYVLNAKPGRYLAVAAGLTDSHGAKYAVFFDRGTILRTEVRVVPGEVATWFGVQHIDLLPSLALTAVQ